MTDQQQQQQNSAALLVLKLQDDFKNILTGVNITEEKFEIDLNGRNDEGTVEILESIVKQLHNLSKDVHDFEFLRVIIEKIVFLRDIHDSIVNGSCFSSIDDVFVCTQESLDKIEVTLFDRTYESTLHSAKIGYNDTVIGADITENIVADDASRSSVYRARDIFGVLNDVAESAHLMPQSRTCSPLWHPFVHWVLYRKNNFLTNLRNNTTSSTSTGIIETGNINYATGTSTGTERQYNLRPRNTTKTNDTDELKQWEYLQKCVQGFKSQKEQQQKQQPQQKQQKTAKRKRDESETSMDKPSNRTCKGAAHANMNTSTSGNTTKKDVSLKNLAKRKKDDTDEATSKGSSRRKNGVGIKNFATNRIGLKNQKTYLDNLHCLFIVPIMTVSDVKDWNGSEYNALVLAGYYETQNEVKASMQDGANEGKRDDLEEDEDYAIQNESHAADGSRQLLLQNESDPDLDKQKSKKIALVYQNIGAHQGIVTFADENECKKACDLLQKMVLCVCKSSRDTFTEDFHKSETMDSVYKCIKTDKPKYIKKERNAAPVPASKAWNNKYRVRKISFSNSNDVSNNPAPDPVLLLGKAASNWLKRHGLFILPGGDADDDDDSSSNSSNYVASLRDEIAMRGWSTEMLIQPHINDVVEVSCFPGGDAIDEPLSDNDE